MNEGQSQLIKMEIQLMCFNIINAAILTEMPSTPKLLFICLAKFANNITGECFPSINTLAKITGFTRKTVIENIKILKRFGVLNISKKGGGRKSNRYILSAGQPIEKTSGVVDTPLDVKLSTDSPDTNQNNDLSGVAATPQQCNDYTPAVYELHPSSVVATPERVIEQVIERERPRRIYHVDQDPIPESKPEPQTPAPPTPSLAHSNDSLNSKTPKPKTPKPQKAQVPKTQKATRITDDWRPTHGQAMELADKYPGLDLETELAKFIAWHSDKGARSSDWGAKLEQWVSNDKLRLGGSSATTQRAGAHKLWRRGEGNYSGPMTDESRAAGHGHISSLMKNLVHRGFA